jgi:hypothetical protein
MGNAHINQTTKEATFEIDGKKYGVKIDGFELKDGTPTTSIDDFEIIADNPKNIHKLAYQTLAIDNLYRKPGAKRHLYSLSDLKEDKWKDDTLQYFTVSDKKNSYMFTMLKIDTDEEFSSKFYEKYPMLYDVDMTHVFIAGGCVSSLLIDHNNKGDVDLFIYGCDEKTAETVVGSILTTIKNWCDSNTHKKFEYKIYKGRFLIKFEIYTFIEDKPVLAQEIQIIFRLYRDKSEIINSFDIGSSAVGFDGKQVYFTEMAAYSYTNMVNIFDTNRSSPTFGSRLYKYAQRGFCIIFPFIKTSKLNELLGDSECSVCFRDISIKKNAGGDWVTATKPKVVWNAYDKIQLSESVIQANIRVPYTNKEMKRFIASYTGYCTDVWYTPKLREGLFSKIKQLYYHNVKPELMNKPLHSVVRYLGAENVGDFVMEMHNDKSSYEEKQAKCAEIREKIYTKMEKRVEEYHKTVQVQKGIVWRKVKSDESIDVALCKTSDTSDETVNLYDVCFANKYIPYYEGEKYQKYYSAQHGNFVWGNISYDDCGHPKHYDLFDKDSYKEYEKCLEDMSSIVKFDSTEVTDTNSELITNINSESSESVDDIKIV